MTTADVLREVAGLDRLRDPMIRYHAVRDADLRVQAFYGALNCTAGDFVEYNLSRVHRDDLPALLNEPTVLGSKEKTDAAKREIRRRGGAVPALRFLCPECGRRFPTVEKTLLHKLRAHQVEEG